MSKEKIFLQKSLIVILTGVASFLLLASTASAAVASYYDFENGAIPNADSLMPNSTPTTVLTDPDGNHFLRMTVSPSDCGSSYNTTCPWNRAELWTGAGPNADSQTVIYSFSMRIPRLNPASNHLLAQLFQGYRITNDYGRTLWLGTGGGNVFVQNDVGGGNQRVNLGAIQYNTWVNYSLVVYLSTDPNCGGIDVYMNGQFMGSITGQATEKTAQYTSDLFLNVVDFNGSAGTADYDNVQISTGGAAAPTPTPTPVSSSETD